MEITLPGFNEITFPAYIDDVSLKFLVLEASCIRKGQCHKLRILKMQLQDQVQRVYPELRQYYYSRKLWYSGFAHFSRCDKKRAGCVDFDVIVTGISEQSMQNIPSSDLERLIKYVSDDWRRTIISQMVKDCDVNSLTELVFGRETNDGVGTFRGKMIEKLFFDMLRKSVQQVNKEGINMLFMQNPYYCNGLTYGKEVDAVLAFYNPSQVGKMLQNLQEQNKFVTCKISNKLK